MTDFFKSGVGDNQQTKSLPLLPLRDVVIFPYMVAPLFVGREKSIRALEEAMKKEKEIVLAAQRDAKTNDPKKEDIYKIGTVGLIVQMLRLPDGTVKVLVEGKNRVKIKGYIPSAAFFLVETEDIIADRKPGAETEALIRTLVSAFEDYAKLNKKVPSEVITSVSTITDPDRLADTIAAHLSFKLEDKQELLEVFDPIQRLEKLYEKIQSEAEILQVEKKIRSRVKKQMEKAQKEYYLTEQMKAIQKELGDKDDLKSEIGEFEEKLKNKNVPEEVEQRIKKEIKKLKMMSPMAAEATVVRNYIDWLLSVPWGDEKTEDRLDIDEATKILDDDHYGLEKPKERIIEYLAVRKLTDKLKGPILCFVGPPGVGKTSLAKSIAKSMGRKFIRISLGGVRDEAEIRGHRRTYIGALPGKIIQGMRKAGTSNPVFLLDEIDKLGTDFRGDPASALLEGLDPEQNKSFNDHYLEVDYDLSNVLFITTANILHTIPWALQDRMEIIHIPGYTEEEKLQIAKKFLVPKQQEDHGLKPENLSISDGGLLSLIRRYTREAGVRTLEREISSLCRKVATRVVKKGLDHHVKIGEGNLQKFLGIAKYKFGQIEENDQIGICTGLAWTEVGGEILTVEVSIVPGKGTFTVTGKLGEVMQESAQAAMSYVRSKAEQLGLERYFYQKVDIHIHVPEGATPKDGPSAGIALVTAIVSALTKNPIDKEVAMTGEITLRGRVLPIGGLKEKILAAHRARVKKVIIPKDNEKDLKDIPKNTLKDIQIVLVDNIDSVIKEAIVTDLPVFEDIISPPHPAAIHVPEEFGSNVNMS